MRGRSKLSLFDWQATLAFFGASRKWLYDMSRVRGRFHAGKRFCCVPVKKAKGKNKQSKTTRTWSTKNISLAGAQPPNQLLICSSFSRENGPSQATHLSSSQHAPARSFTAVAFPLETPELLLQHWGEDPHIFVPFHQTTSLWSYKMRKKHRN